MILKTLLGKKRTLLEKYEIPIEHLDYKYIDNCANVKYLEKLLRVLKSGEEGFYPKLQKHCEEKLRSLFPKSKVLRECVPILKQHELPASERESIEASLENWENEIKSSEKNLKIDRPFKDIFTLPSIRDTKGKKCFKPKCQPPSNKNKDKIKSYEYDKWDKLSVEEMLEMDEEPKQVEKHSPVDFPDLDIDTKSLSEKEKKNFAEKEKVKGNEAFKAGQFSEAIYYYSRSINISPNSASYNNRAQTYIKMKDYEKAISDCEKVLKLEPKNAKAFFRRGTAYQELEQFTEAEINFEEVLKLEPSNKQAQANLKLVREKLNKDKPKKKGTKLTILETQSENSPKNENDTESLIDKDGDKSSPGTCTPLKRIPIEEVDHDEEMELFFKEKIDTSKIESFSNISQKQKPSALHSSEAQNETEVSSKPLNEDFAKNMPMINTPFEFYRFWHTEKVGTVPELASHLLQNIPAQRLPEFLSNKLDGHMMSQILAALKILVSRDPKQTLSLLKFLCTVQRITIVSLFLSPSEKEVIKNLLCDISKYGSSEEVEMLKKTFLS